MSGMSCSHDAAVSLLHSYTHSIERMLAESEAIEDHLRSSLFSTA